MLEWGSLWLFSMVIALLTNNTLQTPEENFYYSPFLKLPDQISKQEKDSLIEAAKKVINQSVIPSFKKVKTFLKKLIFL